jgi:hypothetical protein
MAGSLVSQEVQKLAEISTAATKVVAAKSAGDPNFWTRTTLEKILSFDLIPELSEL